MTGHAVAMLPCHDGRGNGRRNEVDEVLVGANNGGGVVVISLCSFAGFLVRRGAVELVGLEWEGSEPDGHTRGLEVCSIEGNDTDDIVMVWLEVLDSNGGFLGRNITNYGL